MNATVRTINDHSFIEPPFGPAAPEPDPLAPRDWARMSAYALDFKVFAPVRWIVPDLLPEGLALLAGKPKLGKSFAALDMAIAVASGGVAFGSARCEVGDVLYCAMEDSERRLQERIRGLVPMGEPPKRLTIEIRGLQVGNGLEAALTDWLDRCEAPRLIILDTLRCIRPPEQGRGSAYSEDAAALSPLLDLVRERPGLCIMVVHHVRKMDAEDPFDTISGTHGLTGVPDTLMVLARSGERVTLAAKGRDLDDYEKALERDRGTGSWRIVGDARELAKTCEREAVLEVLREAGEPMRATEIATETGGKRENIKRLLARMAKAGEVTRVKTGVYTCPNGPNGPNRHESGGYGGSDDDE